MALVAISWALVSPVHARWSANIAWLNVIRWAAVMQSDEADSKFDDALQALRFLRYALANNSQLKRVNSLEQVAHSFENGTQTRAEIRQAQHELLVADRLREEGRCSEALPLYRELSDSRFYRVEVLLGGLLCAVELNDEAQARHLHAMLSSLQPSRRVEPVSELLGWTPGDGIPVNEAWQFLGFDVLEERALPFSMPAPVVLYWQLDAPDQETQVQIATRGSWKLYRVGNRVYQIGSMTNLVPNPGFEQPFLSSVGGQVHIPGWYSNHYSTTNDQTIRVVLSERQDRSTLALSLWNSAGGPSDLVATMPIQASQLYVFGASLQQSGGSWACAAFAFHPGRLGFSSPDIEGIDKWAGCHGNTEVTSWRDVATILRPRSDSTGLSLFLIDFGPGTAEFDNVLLFPIVSPDELPAGTEP